MAAETLRSLDARYRSTDDGSKYFIVVAARRPDLPSPSGHAFIVWGKEDAAAKMSSQSAFGFYPKHGLDSDVILGDNVPGDLVAESLESTNHQRISGRLIVQVDRADYEKALARIAPWKTDDYNLYAQNCISFAKDIAETIGLQGTDIQVDQLPANFFTALATRVATRFGGTWQSDDAAGRFKLEIEGSRVVWTEASATELHSVTVQSGSESTSDEIRIERANDDATLKFLGFSSAALRAQILAKGPQPSLLKLRRQDGQLIGEWRGLLVKKRADGSLDSLVQPNDMTAKTFTFKAVS